MSYVVLARKYRPQTFSEVVGQDAVTRTLRGAISEERIGHAYLFCGPRGTGKTTLARLFAKALNCEQGPTADPCGTCERCESIVRGSEADVIEIDAASNTGVDYVRELRNQAAYVPLRARFKIYIIDEVHMLSKPAFNALLKTLEEPPPHVKFLFATTAPHKVIDTVLSRCQILRLAPIDEDLIAKRLDEVFAAEGVNAAQGVTLELARRARGGMRDALSLADQLLAQVGSSPALADLELLSSEGSQAGLEKVLTHVVAGDRVQVLQALPSVEGSEAEFLAGLLDHLRSCLLATLCGPEAPMLAGSTASKQQMAELGRSIGPRRLELWLQELLHARERMRVMPSHARLVLEITLLELCRPDSGIDLAEIGERLIALEQRLQSGADALPAASAPRAQPPQAVTAAPILAAPAQAAPTQAAPTQAAPTQAAPTQPVAPAQAATPAPAPPAQTDVQPQVVRPRRPAPLASAPPNQPAPQPQRAPDPASAGPPFVRTNSTHDIWDGFIAILRETSSVLGDLLHRKGSLLEVGQSTARIKLSGLLADEVPLIAGKRTQRTCSQAFSTAVGRAVEVHIEDDSQARPGQEDGFVRKVTELFEGRIDG